MKKNIKLQWWVKEAIADTTTNRFGCSAGLGSGKSHGSAQWFHKRCLQNHKSAYSAVMMPTFQKIWDAAVPTIKKVYDSLGMVEDVHYKVIKQPFPKIVLLPIKHEIHLVSANNPDRIVAVEYSHAWISEAGILKAEAIDNLCDRVRCPQSTIRQIMMEGVPQGYGRFADIFDSEKHPGWYEIESRDYRRKSETPHGDIYYRRFRVSTNDNPFLPPDYIAGLYETYKTRPNYIRAYVHGHFVPLHVGNVYTDYVPEQHDINPIKATVGDPIHLTFDFNANPVSWVALQNKHFTEYDKIIPRYVALNECSRGINQLADAVADFQYKFPVSEFGNTEIFIYGDSTGHHNSHKIEHSDYEVIEDLLRKFGYKFTFVRAIKFNPPETVTVEAANSMFRRDELYVCKNCTELKRSLLFTQWKETVKKIDKPSGEDWTHYSDALKYFIYVLLDSKHNHVRGTNEF